MKLFVTDAEPMLYIRAKVLDHDIGIFHHPLEQRQPGRRLQVQRKRPLIPMEIEHVIAMPRTADSLVGIDTARRLDLDDVRPEIGKDPAEGRSSANARQV